jgi:hypothetical protein
MEVVCYNVILQGRRSTNIFSLRNTIQLHCFNMHIYTVFTRYQPWRQSMIVPVRQSHYIAVLFNKTFCYLQWRRIQQNMRTLWKHMWLITRILRSISWGTTSSPDTIVLHAKSVYHIFITYVCLMISHVLFLTTSLCINNIRTIPILPLRHLVTKTRLH